MVLINVHIGLDSVDSPFGGCTTHASYLVLKGLVSRFGQDLEFIDYPNLVRLNPAIPFKTRGNGAVVLRVRTAVSNIDNLVRTVTSIVKNYLKLLGGNSQPGIAIYLGSEVPNVLRRMYLKALTDYVHRDFLTRAISELEDRVILPLGVSRGVIGALASIGGLVNEDCTYELIVYRSWDNTVNPTRCVDEGSIKIMDQKYMEYTFLNYDYERGRALVSPHGPDPVLLGIRGEDPLTLVDALRSVDICEDVSGWVIFRTNQGANPHHSILRSVSDVRPYQAGCVEGRVTGKPRVLRGGDVMLTISDGGCSVRAVVFRETCMTSVSRELISGDEVRACGVFKHWSGIGVVLHVEKMFVNPVNLVKYINPRCSVCGARMKSAGRGKGWKCVKCGFRTLNAEKEVIVIRRDQLRGHYIPKDSAIKHLVKPLRRYGREKLCSMTRPKGAWFR
ncbi:MAG: hypothetical protein B6U73_01960 [Desulfurococcales archaeon ex4484_204]|nr:MAG: hypothetical protein B6U73_01960 [Desulfurococcales archaeon ex4484_204]